MEVDPDQSSGTWVVSATHLLGILQQALLAIGPVVKKARINYEDGLAYDDWDNIAQCLFENVVERSVLAGLGYDDPVRLPRYAMRYERYDHNVLILLTNPAHDAPGSGPVVFYGFNQGRQPFDTARGVRLADDHRTAMDGWYDVPSDHATFSLLVRLPDGTRTVESLEVAL